MPAELVDANKAASDSRGRYLTYVNWYDHGTCSNADSGENASSKNETQTAIAIGTQHESSSEDEDDRKDHKTLLAAEEVRRSICEQASEESTSLVERDDSFLSCAQFMGAHLLETELSHEAGQRQCCSNEGTALCQQAVAWYLAWRSGIAYLS